MNSAFDFATAPSWTVFTATGTSSWVTIQDAAKVMSFTGTFQYSGGLNLTGTVHSAGLAINQSSIFSMDGLNLDAARVTQLVTTPNGAQQLYAYLLGGNDVFTAVKGGRVLGYGGNDTVDGAVFNGTFDGGAGFDTYKAYEFESIRVDFGTGRVTSVESSGTFTLQLQAVESVVSGSGDDIFVSGSGDDRMDGADGVDTLDFSGSTLAVQVDLGAGTARGRGSDVVLRIENVLGSSAGDSLTGSSGANRLDGRAGADTMRGGLGNDSYVVDQTGDRVVEAAGSGTDNVRSSVSHVLAANVEQLVLSGSAAINGTGNELGNRLTGNVAGNRLDGAAGADTLIGAAGADSLIGGLGVDSLEGGDGNDTLDGGAGGDVLIGGAGNDFYRVDDAADKISADTVGYDTVLASVDYSLGLSWVDKLVLVGTARRGTGHSRDELLVGNSLSNVLDGGLGADTLQGGAGDDAYVVDDRLDLVVEVAGGGTDIVRTVVSYTLAAQVENMSLGGLGAIDGTGNSLANNIIGNAAANRLNGGTGADTLTGGLGNDVYGVDQAGDVISELAGGGRDTVHSTTHWVLGSQLEDLVLVGTAALSGTGNTLANRITGNAGANRIDGAGGADTMSGGAGNDVYLVDSVRDVVIEVDGQGIDTVITGFSRTLEDHVDNLTLTGTDAINGTGNGQGNRIVGNGAANRLDGGEGVDTLVGGGGDDTYVVDYWLDTLVEQAAGGYDIALVSYSYGFVLPANVEEGRALVQLRLTGNALGNLLVGSAVHDTLDGGAGADTLRGGQGSDSYFLDDRGDLVDESGVGEWDVVYSEASITSSFSGIEAYQLLGGADLDVIGNAANNLISGNDGNNRIDGGAGADGMSGAAGNDTYVVDDSGDWVSDTAGDDTVLTSVSLVRGWQDVEHYILTGTADIDFTGTAGIESITGNAGDNVLDGAGGSDVVSFDNATTGVTVDLQQGTAGGFGEDRLLGLFGGVVGSSFDDTIRGGQNQLDVTGGTGRDEFVLWTTSSIRVSDFQTGSDVIVVDQSDLPIGDADLSVDGASVIDAPGGFVADAELVTGAVVAGSAALASNAAAAIGAASGSYAQGQSALFTVAGADGIGLYRFVSSGADPSVGADELTLLALLSGATSVSASDFLWVA
jgi:trimeric autotransporter adhesin